MSDDFVMETKGDALIVENHEDYPNGYCHILEAPLDQTRLEIIRWEYNKFSIWVENISKINLEYGDDALDLDITMVATFSREELQKLRDHINYFLGERFLRKPKGTYLAETSHT